MRMMMLLMVLRQLSSSIRANTSINYKIDNNKETVYMIVVVVNTNNDDDIKTNRNNRDKKNDW